MLTKLSLNVPQDSQFDLNTFTVTMQNVNTENICVVTGPDMFKYLNLGDNG